MYKDSSSKSSHIQLHRLFLKHSSSNTSSNSYYQNQYQQHSSHTYKRWRIHSIKLCWSGNNHARVSTKVLRPSAMENNGVWILAAFDRCVLIDSTVLLNLPDEQGIEFVVANIQGGQKTQSVVVPPKRIAPITQWRIWRIIWPIRRNRPLVEYLP
jgi:hypothetical protein